MFGVSRFATDVSTGETVTEARQSDSRSLEFALAPTAYGSTGRTPRGDESRKALATSLMAKALATVDDSRRDASVSSTADSHALGHLTALSNSDMDTCDDGDDEEEELTELALRSSCKKARSTSWKILLTPKGPTQTGTTTTPRRPLAPPMTVAIGAMVRNLSDKSTTSSGHTAMESDSLPAEIGGEWSDCGSLTVDTMDSAVVHSLLRMHSQSDSRTKLLATDPIMGTSTRGGDTVDVANEEKEDEEKEDEWELMEAIGPDIIQYITSEFLLPCERFPLCRVSRLFYHVISPNGKYHRKKKEDTIARRKKAERRQGGGHSSPPYQLVPSHTPCTPPPYAGSDFSVDSDALVVGRDVVEKSSKAITVRKSSTEMSLSVEYSTRAADTTKRSTTTYGTSTYHLSVSSEAGITSSGVEDDTETRRRLRDTHWRRRGFSSRTAMASLRNVFNVRIDYFYWSTYLDSYWTKRDAQHYVLDLSRGAFQRLLYLPKSGDSQSAEGKGKEDSGKSFESMKAKMMLYFMIFAHEIMAVYGDAILKHNGPRARFETRRRKFADETPTKAELAELLSHSKMSRTTAATEEFTGCGDWRGKRLLRHEHAAFAKTSPLKSKTETGSSVSLSRTHSSRPSWLPSAETMAAVGYYEMARVLKKTKRVSLHSNTSLFEADASAEGSGSRRLTALSFICNFLRYASPRNPLSVLDLSWNGLTDSDITTIALWLWARKKVHSSTCKAKQPSRGLHSNPTPMLPTIARKSSDVSVDWEEDIHSGRLPKVSELETLKSKSKSSSKTPTVEALDLARNASNSSTGSGALPHSLKLKTVQSTCMAQSSHKVSFAAEMVISEEWPDDFSPSESSSPTEMYNADSSAAFQDLMPGSMPTKPLRKGRKGKLGKPRTLWAKSRSAEVFGYTEDEDEDSEADCDGVTEQKKKRDDVKSKKDASTEKGAETCRSPAHATHSWHGPRRTQARSSLPAISIVPTSHSRDPSDSVSFSSIFPGLFPSGGRRDSYSTSVSASVSQSASGSQSASVSGSLFGHSSPFGTDIWKRGTGGGLFPSVPVSAPPLTHGSYADVTTIPSLSSKRSASYLSTTGGGTATGSGLLPGLAPLLGDDCQDAFHSADESSSSMSSFSTSSVSRSTSISLSPNLFPMRKRPAAAGSSTEEISDMDEVALDGDVSPLAPEHIHYSSSILRMQRGCYPCFGVGKTTTEEKASCGVPKDLYLAAKSQKPGLQPPIGTHFSMRRSKLFASHLTELYLHWNKDITDECTSLLFTAIGDVCTSLCVVKLNQTGIGDGTCAVIKRYYEKYACSSQLKEVYVASNRGITEAGIDMLNEIYDCGDCDDCGEDKHLERMVPSLIDITSCGHRYPNPEWDKRIEDRKPKQPPTVTRRAVPRMPVSATIGGGVGRGLFGSSPALFR